MIRVTEGVCGGATLVTTSRTSGLVCPSFSSLHFSFVNHQRSSLDLDARPHFQPHPAPLPNRSSSTKRGGRRSLRPRETAGLYAAAALARRRRPTWQRQESPAAPLPAAPPPRSPPPRSPLPAAPLPADPLRAPGPARRGGVACARAPSAGAAGPSRRAAPPPPARGRAVPGSLRAKRGGTALQARS